MNKTQTISVEKISPRAHKIDSIEFDGGSIESSTVQEKISKGTFTISNNITGEMEDDDGARIKRLTVAVSINPDGESTGYALNMTVSGLYRAEADLDDSEFEKLVLTVGSSDLYSYARNKIAEITQDGLYGVPDLPILSFSFDEE